MTDQRMIGVGGVRRFQSRWVLLGDVVAATPLHLGAGEEGTYVDMPLARDSFGGGPLLTGASLAGALRDYLCDLLFGDRTREVTGQVSYLFGGVREDPKGQQSSLIAFDSFLEAPRAFEIRDGIRVDPMTGTAAAHAKYDLEVWPPGTVLPLRVDLLIREEMGREADLLALLTLALEGFNKGELRLGAKGRRGFGRCKLTNAKVWRFDLSTRNGWLGWLRTGLAEVAEQDNPVPASPIRAPSEPLGAYEEIIPTVWAAGRNAFEDELRKYRGQVSTDLLSLDVPIKFRGGVLIGAPQTRRSGADVCHLQSGGQAVLSGTAISGALRQRALRVAKAVRATRGADEKTWVEELFGAAPPDRVGPSGPKSTMKASRLTTEEVPVIGTSLQITRIQLDRFTQAPVHGALLQEEPVYAGTANLRFDLRLPSDDRKADALAGFFLLVLKDLLLGEVPLGGTTGVGRGAIRPRDEVRIKRREKQYRFTADTGAPDDTRGAIQSWVASFHNYPSVSSSDFRRAGVTEG